MRLLNSVVVNYRTPGDLRVFGDSWKHDSFGDLVVMNVDPQSEDMRVGAQLDREHSDITMVAVNENIGYARACNTGATFGDGDVIAFFNADVVLLPGALQECYEALTSHEDWGVLGPRQIDDQGRVTHAGIIGTNSNLKHRAWHQRVKPGEFEDILDDVPTVSGAAYFIKRQLWDELTECPLYRDIAPLATGAFLPTPFYFEETASSYHARAHGWKCVFFGKATIIHKWHGAVKQNNMETQSSRWFLESQAMFRRFCDHHSIEHD